VKPKIIVLTPVKNEEWILHRFLSVTSQFADEILIADQSSTDLSREICSKYKKVTLIQNPGDYYSEAERQLLLISTARKLWPGPKILLGLDADEVLAADAMQCVDWQSMLAAAPGTILLFEKPDLLPGLDKCIRYPTNPMPLGFVDDGYATHSPLQIHSPRVPQPANAVRLFLSNIKILHYAHARMRAQLAKVRYYSVQENLKQTNPLRRRRAWYGNFIKKHYVDTAAETTSIREEWFVGWESMGIDMHNLPDEDLTWHEIEILRAFAKYGENRFWLEPIWDIDWNELQQKAADKKGIPFRQINHPPIFYRFFASGVDIVMRLIDSMPWFKSILKKYFKWDVKLIA
jgi:hypothetical protein